MWPHPPMADGAIEYPLQREALAQCYCSYLFSPSLKPGAIEYPLQRGAKAPKLSFLCCPSLKAGGYEYHIQRRALALLYNTVKQNL